MQGRLSGRLALQEARARRAVAMPEPAAPTRRPVRSWSAEAGCSRFATLADVERIDAVDESESRLSDGEPPVVTVRYWAAARAAAGLTEEKIAAATLAEALTQLRSTHGSSTRFERVLGMCSFLVGDQPVGSRAPSTVALRPGDVIEVLPPFAGG